MFNKLDFSKYIFITALSVSSLLGKSAYGAGSARAEYNDGEMLRVVNIFAPANRDHRRNQADLIHDTMNTINRIANQENVSADNVRAILDDQDMFPERIRVETPAEQARRYQLEAGGAQLDAMEARARQVIEDGAIAARLAREWGQQVAAPAQEIIIFGLNAQELEEARVLQRMHDERRRELQAIRQNQDRQAVIQQIHAQGGQQIAQQMPAIHNQIRQQQVAPQIQARYNVAGQPLEQRILAQQAKIQERQNSIKKDLQNIASFGINRTNLNDKNQNEVISKAADAIILNQNNAAIIIKQLEKNGIKFTDQEVQNALDDQVITLKSNQEKAILFAISLQQLPKKTRKEAIDNIVKNATEQIIVENEVIQAVEENINNRLDNIRFLPNNFAAGDDDNKMPKSFWLSGLYGTSQQNKSKNTVGYKGNVFGPTVGFDLNINDNTIIGAAYSYILSNFKHANQSYGKKTSAQSHVLSLYTQAQIGDNLLWNNIFSLGTSNVTGKSSRPISQDNYRIAIGKLTNKAYSLETILGYKVPTNNDLIILANIGMRIGQYRDDAYTEEGAGVQNVYVASRTDTSVVGILGSKLMVRRQVSEETEIIPAINASIENNFNSKKSKVKAKFAWMNDYFQSESNRGKVAKISYNIGTSLLTRHKNIELLAAYNCNLRNKYQSHQGYLKFKLLF